MFRFSTSRAQRTLRPVVSSETRAQRTLRPVRLFVTAGPAIAFLTAGPAARAQDEGPWRRFVMDALNAASAQDYPKAEQGFVRGVREAESFGQNDVRVGSTLNSLGLVYRAEKK